MMRLMYVRFHRSYTTTNCCIATLIACVAMETFTFKPDEMSYLKLELNLPTFILKTESLTGSAWT